MIAILLNGVVLAALLILLGASVSALREGIRQKARGRGILLAAGVAVLSLVLLWAVLV